MGFSIAPQMIFYNRINNGGKLMWETDEWAPK